MDLRKEAAYMVIQMLNEAGYEAYLVGGCVRDLLLNRIPNDYDIATSATPPEVQKVFDRSFATGIEHGTVTVVWEKVPIEVTTFRTEGAYIDHRRPAQVQFVRSLQDDLQRRDFTINAMAMDRKGNLYDYFGGQTDLQIGLIRTVGVATDRFQEDALRMVRAARFAAQFSFLIDPLTWEAMVRCKQDTRHLSVERVTSELEKILLSPTPELGLKILLQTGLFHHLPPFNKWKWSTNDLEHSLKCIPIECNRVGKWAWLLESFGTMVSQVESRVRDLRLSKKDMLFIQSMIEISAEWKEMKQLEVSWIKMMFLKYGFEPMMETYRIRKAASNDSIGFEEAHLHTWWDEMPVKKVTDLKIQGNEIITVVGKKAGPWVKEVLLELCRLVAFGHVPNHRETLLKVGAKIGAERS